MTGRTRFSMAQGLMLVALFVVAGNASAAPPTIESIKQAVGQRGTTFDLVLTGARLGQPQELLIDSPGLTVKKLTSKSETEAVLTIEASPTCRLGEYPFRLRTNGGASEVRSFQITPFPVVSEIEPNDKVAEAQLVASNSTIAATIESAGVDHFAIKLKKGERLSAEVVGVRLGAELTDTVLSVFGPDGKELARADDTPLFRQDPFLSIVVPVDGTYIVQVHECNYGGSETSRYLLHLGNFARPAAVFPAGGQLGTTFDLTFLDPSFANAKKSLALPKEAQGFQLHPSDGAAAAPTAQPFRVSPFPNVLESDKKEASNWPVAFNGIIAKVGEQDDFRFRAKRGDSIDITAYAFRIGSPLDPVVTLLDSELRELASNDDAETHDSQLRVSIPADGEYVVRVSDKRKQAGPNFLYRVELTQPRTGLTIFAPGPLRKSQERQVIAIPKGGRICTYLGVRRDGCRGPVKITASDLPNGVKATISELPADEYLVPVVLEAAADASLSGKLVSFTGSCTDGKSTTMGNFQHGINLVSGPGDSSIHRVDFSKLSVVVVEAVPYSLSLQASQAALPTFGSIDITMKVQRAKDFTDALDVHMVSLPPGVEAPAVITIPGDKSEATVRLTAQPTADIGRWPLYAELRPARVQRGDRDPLSVGMNGLGTPPPAAGMGSRRRRGSSAEFPSVYSELLTITVAEAPVQATAKPVVVEQGRSAKIAYELSGVLPGEAFVAKMDGLPPRATAQPVNVKPGAKSIEFTVNIDGTTPPGSHDSLVCELTGTISGQTIVYRVGMGGKLKIVPQGAGLSSKSDKPLSPLEALREAEKKK
ncbi:MAG: PPC domain-containing protein [Fimbriiglobus sp.]